MEVSCSPTRPSTTAAVQPAVATQTVELRWVRAMTSTSATAPRYGTRPDTPHAGVRSIGTASADSVSEVSSGHRAPARNTTPAVSASAQ